MSGKKYVLALGAVAIALLMVSTVTAVPETQSKPVMDQIAQKESLSSQLVKIASSVKLNSQNFYINPNDVTNFQQNFDISALFMDDDFIALMNSPEIYNIITSNDFSTLYNTEAIQSFVSSAEFISFFNSDAAQYLLDHLDIINGGMQVNSQNSNIVVSQQASKTMQNTVGTTQSTSVHLQAQPAGLEVFVLLAAFIIGLVVGIVTWIPAIVFIILTIPVIPLLVLFMTLEGGIWLPGSMILGTLFIYLVEAGAAIAWPLIVAIIAITGG